jgi:cellulose biosynthesis protein BcsQ
VYVISFYSFKGGVGRTMALVNIGVELARLGKKILLVDFDLEAPSLLTFNIPGKETCDKGIVEYVTEYLKTDRAPSVTDYVSVPRTYPSGGSIQIMPAGSPGAEYQSKLAAINWLELYEQSQATS